jgi:hypothetical protein
MFFAFFLKIKISMLKFFILFTLIFSQNTNEIPVGKYYVTSISCIPTNFLNNCQNSCELGTIRDYSYNANADLVSSKTPPVVNLPSSCSCPFDVPHVHIWNTTFNAFVYTSNAVSINPGKIVTEITTGDGNTVTIKKITQDPNVSGTPPECIYQLQLSSGSKTNLTPVNTNTSPVPSTTAQVTESNSGSGPGIIAGITLGCLIFLGIILFIILYLLKKKDSKPPSYYIPRN